jgi:PAS domain S-box-containing protein
MSEEDSRTPGSEISPDDEHRDRAAFNRITTAWQEASAALADSELRFRELVENSLGLICTHDLAGTILSINPAAAKSLGYRREDGVGRNLADFLERDKRQLFPAYLQRINEHGHDAGLMSVVASDGSVRIWMYRNVISQAGGHAPYVLGHAIDVTERIAAERTLRDSEQALKAAHAELEARVRERTIALEEANRLKDEFLSTLSHELRTPLNAIYGWARILRSRNLEPSTAHAVDVIERNARAQLRLIDDVLDVSRIITGKMRLTLEPVDVASILRATIDTVRPSIELKRIHFDAHIPDDVPPVQADRHRLEQVFWNLLSNALKFTRPGDAITVSLRVAPGEIELEVVDTGIGIRQDVLPIVFDRFRQADSSTTRTHGGLGLGLAIVKEITQLHGGSVRAASAGEGRGATFTIRLPAIEDAAVDGLPVSPPEPLPSAGRLRGRQILVVEDHDDARELIVAVLEAAGAQVIGAPSAEEGIARATQTRPDLVVVDIGLPGVDGYGLLARLRTVYPDLPAVALTAYARASDRERALAAGFQEYGIKPIEPAALVELVEAAITMGRSSR